VLVFVYGTLRTGFRNHSLMSGARLQGLDETKALFRLVDFGSFPAILDEPRTTIVGELWEASAPCVARLDVLEEVPDLYVRREVELRSGRTAWTYFLAGSPEAHHLVASDVPSGDYLDVNPPSSEG